MGSLAAICRSINGETDLTDISFWGDLGFDWGDRVDIVTAHSIVGNFGNTIANEEFVDASGHNMFLGNDGSTIFLQAVPEPGSIALWSLLGLAACAAARERSKSDQAEGRKMDHEVIALLEPHGKIETPATRQGWRITAVIAPK